MGYIISPPVTCSGWEIKYQSFQKKTKSLIEEFNSKTVMFPSTNRTQKISNEEEIKYIEYNFVKKIDKINYCEVKSEAISDFIYARKTINEELCNHEIPSQYYNNYQEEIYDTYKSKYRTASLETKEQNFIKRSKIFYNDIIGGEAPNFRNFNDTPKKFKNGFLHMMADDDSQENDKKIKWELEVGSDE